MRPAARLQRQNCIRISCKRSRASYRSVRIPTTATRSRFASVATAFGKNKITHVDTNDIQRLRASRACRSCVHACLVVRANDTTRCTSDPAHIRYCIPSKHRFQRFQRFILSNIFKYLWHVRRQFRLLWITGFGKYGLFNRLDAHAHSCKYYM